ncbi:hypothetical protein FKW77_010047 [Venturia effusa]|uniref:F-box domain-containing protein n=1 Tax=Venturia effusa TaxID=50376 RepID=A0A517LA33_9PEZI|nr:hypothetical protein FKW77_010047 [Venturia effusa]
MLPETRKELIQSAVMKHDCEDLGTRPWPSTPLHLEVFDTEDGDAIDENQETSDKCEEEFDETSSTSNFVAQSKASFFALPQELRDQIYDLLIDSTINLSLTIKSDTSTHCWYRAVMWSRLGDPPLIKDFIPYPQRFCKFASPIRLVNKQLNHEYTAKVISRGCFGLVYDPSTPTSPFQAESPRIKVKHRYSPIPKSLLTQLRHCHIHLGCTRPRFVEYDTALLLAEMNIHLPAIETLKSCYFIGADYMIATYPTSLKMSSMIGNWKPCERTTEKRKVVFGRWLLAQLYNYEGQ